MYKRIHTCGCGHQFCCHNGSITADHHDGGGIAAGEGGRGGLGEDLTGLHLLGDDLHSCNNIIIIISFSCLSPLLSIVGEIRCSRKMLTRLLLYLNGWLINRGSSSGLCGSYWRWHRASLLEGFGRLLAFGKLGKDLCRRTNQGLWRGKSCRSNFHSCCTCAWNVWGVKRMC